MPDGSIARGPLAHPRRNARPASEALRRSSNANQVAVEVRGVAP